MCIFNTKNTSFRTINLPFNIALIFPKPWKFAQLHRQFCRRNRMQVSKVIWQKAASPSHIHLYHYLCTHPDLIPCDAPIKLSFSLEEIWTTLKVSGAQFHVNLSPPRTSAWFWLGASMPAYRLRRRKFWKFDYEMVHSEVGPLYLNKYVVSIAPFSTPDCPDCSQNITQT